jgi:hypothetical protein
MLAFRYIILRLEHKAILTRLFATSGLSTEQRALQSVFHSISKQHYIRYKATISYSIGVLSTGGRQYAKYSLYTDSTKHVSAENRGQPVRSGPSTSTRPGLKV